MNMKRAGSILLVLAMLFCGISAGAEAGSLDVSTLYKSRDTDDSWSTVDADEIDLGTLTEPEWTISAKGSYVLSGSYNGRIVIDVAEEEKVRLILNGVTITSADGPAIYEKQADKLIITLAADTENVLTDGGTLTDDDDTIGAGLYAEDDLSINGTGSLTVNGTQKHGIQSKADLIIANGKITVNAANDGIRGRNSVLVLNGEISVTAGGDGITSTRKDSDGKGWIVLAGGKAAVKTGDGAAKGKSKDGASRKGIKAAADLTVLGGEYTLDCADDGLHAANIIIYGGSFEIRSGDDGMNADGTLTINGGKH